MRCNYCPAEGRFENRPCGCNATWVARGHGWFVEGKRKWCNDCCARHPQSQTALHNWRRDLQQDWCICDACMESAGLERLPVASVASSSPTVPTLAPFLAPATLELLQTKIESMEATITKLQTQIVELETRFDVQSLSVAFRLEALESGCIQPPPGITLHSIASSSDDSWQMKDVNNDGDLC